MIGFDYNHNAATTATAAGSPARNGRLHKEHKRRDALDPEAMIYPSSTNVANQEIICTDSPLPPRVSISAELRRAVGTELHCDQWSGSKTSVPSGVTDPLCSNNWFHVAAAYDGTSVVLYWTKVLPSTVAANPISTNAVAVGTSFGAVQGSLGYRQPHTVRPLRIFRDSLTRCALATWRGPPIKCFFFDRGFQFHFSLGDGHRPGQSGLCRRAGDSKCDGFRNTTHQLCLAESDGGIAELLGPIFLIPPTTLMH